MGRLEGRRALVTGGAQGIGRGIAVELAREGADVAVMDLAAGEDVAAEVQAVGRRCVVFAGDVGRREDVDGAVAGTVAEFGGLDVVVANAAFSVRKPLLELSVEDVERTWAVSLWGVFHTCQASARYMAAHGGGSVVVVSSVHSFRPYAGASAYNGAKAAVNQMAATWAVELAAHGIRVNVIEPGWTDTPGERRLHGESELAAAGAGLLMGRLGRAEEVGRAAVFLASAESSYMTGAVLRADGGYSLEH